MDELEKINEPDKLPDSELLCPVRFTLDIFGSKWKLPILCILSAETSIRYNTLKRRLNGITNIMLAKSLKELQETDMVNRVQYNEVPLKVEYSLTERGSSLVPHLKALAQWGTDNMAFNNDCTPKCAACLDDNIPDDLKLT